MAGGEKVNQAGWTAEFERRRAAGQIGYRRRSDPSVTWKLTEYNVLSFEDDPDIVATFKCANCRGSGLITREGKV